MANILIVDDEEDMRELVSMYLQNSGYNTFEAEDDRAARFTLQTEEIDLVLLDIMLPNKNGFEICEEIRQESDIPIIFLSAKGEEWDKVKAFQLGGDDYLVKPFSPGELMARIEAVLRRSSRAREEDAEVFGVLKLARNSRKVTVRDRHVSLTFKEFELLKLLMSHPENVFTREALLDSIWGMDYSGGVRTVDTHIKTLRMKLGKEAGSYIQTVWGCGYALGAPK